MADLALENVEKTFGAGAPPVLHGIDLAVADGEFMVFVGPSGCGKSTTLRLIAGLEDITRGTLRIGGRIVNDTPAAQRGVAMVFQSYALYPHMTVRENLGFALKLARQPRAAIDEAVARVSRILQLDPLLGRKPAALSGGQRQRVAIGRAIVRQPEVFLFDEPLSNLDAALRVQMRAELARLHRELGTTMVYVTHDQVEAMTLGQRIAVFNHGRIEQCGEPLALYDRPANRFVAGFIGNPAMNFLPARADGAGAIHVAGASLEAPTAAGPLPAELVLGIRPEHVSLAPAGEGLSGCIEFAEHLGNEQIVHVGLPAGERVLARLPADGPRPRRGEAVGLRWPAACTHWFGADETGARLN
ncbi:sn-glycerol-3-phosphate ABC transporter ATP-binding protein UgpC [Ideonella sp.]|uniref:ABC transporter ATP-binding protein n=1 Tax=Ideonella sp. TaxID=1929293 RepID=UPI002B4593CB|nr:sn-glycerol-3-phosphate ABC transporter ATP-binding protein UgpC [Ideonella sp.]HJV69901.1 sn-glycerol-3-phosphate ABC transporter ATP-binding protein UgpC [Ideonella sp.]